MSSIDDDLDLLGKVLIVDDEPAIRTLLVSWLEPSGFEVELATNGKEALEKASEVHPDAVVMDASMPVMGGFEALAEFKRRPDLKSIPIIMLTVHAEVRDMVNALDIGATDYLQKPFNPQILLARLRSVIRNKGMCPNRPSAHEEPAMFVANSQGHIEFANQAALRCFGLDDVKKIETSCQDLLSWAEASPWEGQEPFFRSYNQVKLNADSDELCNCSLCGVPAGGSFAFTLTIG